MPVNKFRAGALKHVPSIGFASMDWSKVDDAVVPNGCTWYRCILPAQQLNKAGIHSSFGMLGIKSMASIKRFVIKRVNETVSDGHNVIVLKVLMAKAVLDFMPEAQRRGQKVVVDIDDLFDEIHETNHAYTSTDVRRNADNNREIYKEIIGLADALICSTPFIAEYYGKIHPNKPIFMVRNSIDINRWSRLKTKDKKPVIGWLGATPWRSMDLEQIAPFFDGYLESRDLKFHHAGHISWAAGAHLRLKIDPKRCSVSPMVPLFELPTVYNNFDIGIVPLNDIPFNRAKSFIKGLEYAAAGIPFVASALPEYEFLAEQGIGRVAKTPKQWMAHFDELLDFETRQNESLKNWQIAKEKFSIEAHADEWVDVFKKIIDL
jgi:glycosyltransferase involved in cell wall biosynthesis